MCVCDGGVKFAVIAAVVVLVAYCWNDVFIVGAVIDSLKVKWGTSLAVQNQGRKQPSMHVFLVGGFKHCSPCVPNMWDGWFIVFQRAWNHPICPRYAF